MTEDRVAWHLDNWESWCASYSTRLGISPKSAGMAPAGMNDFEGMCFDGDKYAAQVTEAAVYSLPPAQAAAIERKWELCAAYRFPRDNYAEMLALAMKRLAVALGAQGLV